jgi:hypothetical protein
MIRSRKTAKSSDDFDDDGTGSKNHARKRPSLAGDASSSSKALVSNQTLVIVVTVVIGLGFLLEHYFARFNASTTKSGIVIPSAVKQGVSLIPPEEDAQLLRDADGQMYHLIFSTDCGTYQHWQSYLTFFRAMKVKQPGTVTRIASGCTQEEKTVIDAWFQNHIQHMSQRFHLLLTPHFSGVKDADGNIVGDYKFFNKPFGLKYWLEHSDLVDFNNNGQFPNSKNDIVILIDPDMSMMRPITKDFTSDEDVVIAPFRKEHLVARTVGPGKPFAQTYGFGSQFLKLDLEKIGGTDSRLPSVTHEEGRLYYPVGPPYIGTATDMHAISLKWTEFVPKVHQQYPHLLAEMFAFSLAAAHLDLKFQLIQSLMISDTHTGSGEGWPLVDSMPPDNVCNIAREVDYKKHPLPHVVHLCQRYSLGKDWFFGKRKIPHDVFDCQNPLFEEPPNNIATMFDYKWPPGAKDKTPLTPELAHREAFMICHLTAAMNEAAEYFKRSACEPTDANLKRQQMTGQPF